LCTIYKPQKSRWREEVESEHQFVGEQREEKINIGLQKKEIKMRADYYCIYSLNEKQYTIFKIQY
jgi:hypothetical protein